ncbi:hypothetical protein CALVIDRAFT_533296 [Calocera viscosa TUFC12733]|uniref:Ribokinase-like protein n=1 Tax=Calocera viscosa (strain TUFC12733) TaxID=1330018 RepID=A0A167RJ92_CALVF|nr:hypothetical protein CALVIDRAFT_533296 [Calocera viscosa TUFC12733]
MAQWLNNKKDLPPLPPSPHDNPNNLRVLAIGTLYEIQTFYLDAFPDEGLKLRAQSVTRERGGSAASILHLLAQFDGVSPFLCAPVGSRRESTRVESELDDLGIGTEFLVRREGEQVPTSYIMQSLGTGSRTVIHHNPLPDIAHSEFVRLFKHHFILDSTPSISSTRSVDRQPSSPGFPRRVPPFDWVHFEGRATPSMLSNLRWVCDVSREQGYRDKVVVSLGLERPVQDMEELIRFADVVFFSKALAMQATHASPKSFLLSHALASSPHSILLATPSSHTSGAALLSVPNKEYYQSSELVKDTSETPSRTNGKRISGFGGEEDGDFEIMDLSGTGEAFIAGMIYSLTRRLLPGLPYTPSDEEYTPTADEDKGRWRLEECLRFSTELAGRKNRRPNWDGLAEAMAEVGWFSARGVM